MDAWREVELAACEELPGLLGEHGPSEDELKAIRAATFTVEAVNEREATTDHDVAAFVDVLGRLGRRGRTLHPLRADLLRRARHGARASAARGRSDRRAGRRELVGALGERAREHGETLCVGRRTASTPSRRLRRRSSPAWPSRHNATACAAGARLRSGRGRGTVRRVGTYAATSPEFERRVLERLGLAREDVSTQVVARDRHAELLGAIALAGAGLERFATECVTCSAPRCARCRSRSARPEGLLGDAPQAQPDQVRAHLRVGARAARQRPRRPGRRPAVARARYLPFLGGAGHPARLDDRARLPAAPRDRARAGHDRRRRADAGEPRADPRRAVLGSACYWRWSSAGFSRDDAYR